MLQMKEKTRSVGESSEKSPANVDILTVKCATDEISAREESNEPAVKYIDRLRCAGDGRIDLVFRRYLELMRAVRPPVTESEVILLLQALSPTWGLFLCPADELCRYILPEVRDWCELYPGFVSSDVDADAFATKVQHMSPLELCSLVDSLDQFWRSANSSLSRDVLADYFNLETERGVACCG